MSHSHWRLQQWQRIIWTDESLFKLVRVDNRMRVFRSPRHEWIDRNVYETTTGGGGSVHVWGAFHYNGRSELVVVNRVNGAVYQQVLQNHLLPFAQATLGGVNNWLLMDDNATPHRAGPVRDYKEQVGIRNLPWPSRSPDMNPIEHVWDYMKRRVAARDPKSLIDLRQCLFQVWDEVQDVYLRDLVLKMPRRINSLLLAHGGYTRY